MSESGEVEVAAGDHEPAPGGDQEHAQDHAREQGHVAGREHDEPPHNDCGAQSGTATPASSTPGTPGSEKASSPSFKAQFRAFSRFGDSKSDGKHITLSQSDKWMKQAKVIDGKKINTTDTGIYFKKFKIMKMTLDDYEKYLADLSKNKKVDLQEMKRKMAACGTPGLTSNSPASKAAAAVDRLTDASKYTGSHKQRFDDSGKGRGIAGRKDLPDDSGYVQGYQNKDSYKPQ